ncbi:MAG: MATE family efflux transporter [Eubacterium sp.]|nr:MATE family efflux transporter [Eubacterium sp.]
MSKKKKTANLLEGSIGRGILVFVLPIMLGTLIQQFYVTTDAIIVGQFSGKEGLAAIDAVATLFKFPLNFMNGLAAGATIHISHHFGAGDEKKWKRAIQAACATAIVLGIVCSVAGVCFSNQLLHVMDVPEDIFTDTLAYTQIYFAGIWSMILYNMAAGILRALGDSKSPLYVLILCSLSNVVGDYLLVGVFDLGVEGAAIATVAAQIISVVCALLLLNRSMTGKQSLIERPLWGGGEHVKAMLVTGFPLALQSMLFPVANSIVQASVNSMGSDAIAAWGVCNKLDMFIWLVADAMGPALTTYVAQNLGAGHKHRVKKGVLTGTLMSMGAVAAISLVLFLGAEKMGGWFVSGEDARILIPLVVTYMQMMAPFYLFYALAEALSGACCGIGNTLPPMVATLVTICLLRVAGIWLIQPRYESMECIVWIYIVSWIAAGLTFLVMYLVLDKKRLSSKGETLRDSLQNL